MVFWACDGALDADLGDDGIGAFERDAGPAGGEGRDARIPTDIQEPGGRDSGVEGAEDAEVGEGPDAEPLRDRDAQVLQPLEDASIDAPDLDAQVEEGVRDAAPRADAFIPEDNWGPCAVRGVPGECLHVDDCFAPARSTPGLCPGPAEIQCCAEVPEEPPVDQPPVQDCDPDDMPTPHEGLRSAPGEGPCPEGMAWIRPDNAADYCMDRYEGALMEVFGDGSESPWSPYHNPGNRRVRAVSIEGAVPQGYIDGVQAQRACEEAGKRLCSDQEWLRACQGAEGLRYPYGAERVDGLCNDARAQHPAVQLFPNDPNPFARIQHACINQLPEGLAPSGDHGACVTEEGVYDLMGNLHEWTSDPTGTFRGGFYVDTVRNGPGCLYRTTAHNRLHWDYSTGFRCCADGE